MYWLNAGSAHPSKATLAIVIISFCIVCFSFGFRAVLDWIGNVAPFCEGLSNSWQPASNRAMCCRTAQSNVCALRLVSVLASYMAFCEQIASSVARLGLRNRCQTDLITLILYFIRHSMVIVCHIL